MKNKSDESTWNSHRRIMDSTTEYINETERFETHLANWEPVHELS